MIASRKGGHKFPALAIVNKINAEKRTHIFAQTINFLDHLPIMSLLDRLCRWSDLNLRSAWRAGYSALSKNNSFFLKLYSITLRAIISRSATEKKIRKLANNINLIVSVQPEINTTATIMKKWFAVPIHTMIMDYSAHAGWVDPGIDQYYVSTEYVRQQLKNYGVAEEKIIVTGAPIQPGFETAAKISIQQQRCLLGINPFSPTVLVMAGYLGRMVNYIGIIESLQKNIIGVQILVSTGKNKKIHNQLLSTAYLNVFPYYDVPTIHPVMRAADLVISKPGGMVIADCLAHGKPMLLINPQGGALQEFVFASMIARLGAGLHLKNVKEIGIQARFLFENRSRLDRMAHQSFKHGQDNRLAVNSIAEQIINTIEKPQIHSASQLD